MMMIFKTLTTNDIYSISNSALHHWVGGFGGGGAQQL